MVWVPIFGGVGEPLGQQLKLGQLCARRTSVGPAGGTAVALLRVISSSWWHVAGCASGGYSERIYW